MEPNEFLKRFKRGLDGYISYRKAFILIVLFLLFLLYAVPSAFKWMFVNKLPHFDTNSRCISDHLYTFREPLANFDAVRQDPVQDQENNILLFVGNGKIGQTLNAKDPLLIRSKRLLDVRVPHHAIITASMEGVETKEANILHYTTGQAHRIQCLEIPGLSMDIHYIYFAHRTIPSIFVQDIKITNPSETPIKVHLQQQAALKWTGSLQVDESVDNSPDGVTVITGQVRDPENPNMIYIVAIASNKFPATVGVDARRSSLVHHLTSVHYEGPVERSSYDTRLQHVLRKAKLDLEQALNLKPSNLKGDHVAVWQQLWSSGFSISYSRANGALNGDKINASIYFILSHTPSPIHEIDTLPQRKKELIDLLSNPDRCYQGHHTLQASTLWSPLTNVDEVNRVVRLWMLTLSKQGCEKLISAGSDGVLQAMILSFGALKFANHHLEFFMHPGDLHRDYYFRRISYGNATHLNITVTVGEDNKALLYVAVDRSDKDYYACDGGCLDPPVLLRTEKKQFPVKLTNPVTAILYITADKQHMEELKHTIHVSAVQDAPAHEHHVLALHRHGHHLGGLPIFFWAFLVVLVVIFHLFLFKLIYNEYFAGHDKMHAKYTL